MAKEKIDPTVEVMLCANRHVIRSVTTGEEVKKFIFGEELKMNIPKLEEYAEYWLNANPYYNRYQIYVTGFTPALTAFIRVVLKYNAKSKWKKKIDLLHYDSDVGTYIKQKLIDLDCYDIPKEDFIEANKSSKGGQ